MKKFLTEYEGFINRGEEAGPTEVELPAEVRDQLRNNNAT